MPRSEIILFFKDKRLFKRKQRDIKWGRDLEGQVGAEGDKRGQEDECGQNYYTDMKLS